MGYSLYIVNNVTGEGFDVSTIAHGISHTTTLEGQAGKLTFTLEKDPNNVLKIGLGNIIMFWCDRAQVFYGYIFNIQTNSSQTYTVTAYDQMRYLQNHDYLFMDKLNLKTLFEKICNGAKISKYKILGQAKNLTDADNLDPYFFNDTSYFDMFQYAITQTNKKFITNSSGFLSESALSENPDDSTKGYKFFIRDNFGTLELNDIENNVKFRQTGIDGGMTKAWTGTEWYEYDISRREQLEPLIIGDESLLMDYSYELDIDRGTYNQIFLMDTIKSNSETSDKKSTNKVLSLAQQDDASIKKWGVLRKIVNLKTNYGDGSEKNKRRIEEYMKLSLLEGSQPSKTLKLTALGYNGINAGDGFCLQLKKLGINQMMYVLSATHSYEADKHVMELQVATSRNLTEVV